MEKRKSIEKFAVKKKKQKETTHGLSQSEHLNQFKANPSGQGLQPG
jgi:hypothetical protein